MNHHSGLILDSNVPEEFHPRAKTTAERTTRRAETQKEFTPELLPHGRIRFMPE
jgi:hypothetical protein